MMSGQKAFRGAVFHCLADPGERDDAAAAECFDDGLLVIANGRVEALGPAETLLAGLPSGTEVVDYRNRIIVPGLIDTHVHFAQLDIIASHGAQLLDWLESYAYPAEAACADAVHARALAEAFLDELLRNGTTTALVFATVHPHSVEAIFEAAAARNMRLIAGKVLMDRLCRPDLADDAESGYAESRRLIEKWHGRDRLGYAITPRFALTSSERQLQLAGKLAAEFPDVWVHTHLAENRDEIAAIADLFPDNEGYLDVYASHGLLRRRSVFAHCVHLETADAQRLGRGGGAVAFCPSSNLFLGSGLFDLRAMAAAGVRTGLATDVGAGTSLSLLRTMGEAYKVLQLQGQVLPVTRAFYLATLGAARALDLDDRIGNFVPGKEADFTVLDPGASALMSRRARASASIGELLFAMMFLGDERHVAATYVQGVAADV
jgi:guanine deaminase